MTNLQNGLDELKPSLFGMLFPVQLAVSPPHLTITQRSYPNNSSRLYYPLL
jgi:hypothetical protein